jgi:hypothetical protein
MRRQAVLKEFCKVRTIARISNKMVILRSYGINNEFPGFTHPSLILKSQPQAWQVNHTWQAFLVRGSKLKEQHLPGRKYLFN